MLSRDRGVALWGWLPVNWVVKRWDRVSKHSMEYGGREVNHYRVGHLRVVGKALHITTSSFMYRPTCVTYILTCLSGSVSPA